MSAWHIHHGSAGAATAWPEPGSATPVVHQRRLCRVLEMIEAEPGISVRELALEVRLSPGYLQRLFKHEAGVHIHDVIAEHRLQRAAQLLSGSDMPIKEIAYAAGYQHHSSFVRAFQRRFGQTPRDFRVER